MKTFSKFAMAFISSMFMCSSLFASTHTGSASLTETTIEYIVNKEDIVKANTTDVYTVTLRADEAFYIYVSGDGDTDLDLFVYDENDNLIDSDTDSDDKCLCTVRPKWTGKFKIKIKNLGNLYNRYHFYII